MIKYPLIKQFPRRDYFDDSDGFDKISGNGFDKIYNDIESVYEIYGQKEDPHKHLGK